MRHLVDDNESPDDFCTCDGCGRNLAPDEVIEDAVIEEDVGEITWHVCGDCYWEKNQES